MSFAAWRARLPRHTGMSALARIATLRPRDADFHVLEVDPGSQWGALLRLVPPTQCLLAAAAAGPNLERELAARLGGDATARALCQLLAGPFLPAHPLCPLDEAWRARLRPLALGRPGDPVDHGLFPSRASKLARLLLAAAGDYPADAVLLAARDAYARERPYHGHDALACALVCAGAPARALLRERLRDTRAHRGWRSRKQTHALGRWARRFGYMSEETD
ncbi:hypothetical protein SAMN02745121_05284 [Nannocystis exedens]|uniref:Uncharacterized protein n=1 Tax=Nannocystis exedens TaxID=54 RepID=A0A1I2CX27_9BACT|nr:hypothetical protein [Nannocystis exedens]PCC68610.1 hypothetical protein NAEX_01626 [Nannocystis exedens]SFE72313.1 hypothetical protein SAMN02745121_05284 [Nannocystis exedens]